MIRYAGKNIFGTLQLRQQGPTAKTRYMRQQLPGVRGYRIFRIGGNGPDSLVWSVSGRLIALTLADLERQIASGLALMDGRVGVFESTGGIVYRNCELVDYRPVPPFQRAFFNGGLVYTCMVQATIEQASP